MDTPLHWSWSAYLLEPFVPALRSIGLLYYLPLFSPNPPTSDKVARVEVVYADGTRSVWPYSPVFAFPYLTQYYQRLAHEYLTCPRGDLAWRDFCRYVVRNIDGAHKPPVRVEISVKRGTLHGPGTGMAILNKTRSLYSYSLQPEDLP